MSDVREATGALLDDDPGLEDDLRELLAVDARGPWTFDDVATDAGTFGEVVDAGIVESVEDGYRLADPAALRAVLDGEAEPSDEQDATERSRPSVSLPSMDRRRAGLLAGAVTLLVVFRVGFIYEAVFRGGDVVLVGNDPYLYRFWVEHLLAADVAAFDPGSLSALPTRLVFHDVLVVVVLWWTAALFGGGVGAAGVVLAVYPVVTAAVSAVAVYLFATRFSADWRVGVTAVLALAVTPTHAFRTALGFADHHAFDYTILVLTALALLALSRKRFDRAEPLGGLTARGWLAVVGLGLGTAAQTAAWRGGPLLMLPIAIYLVLRVPLDARAGRSPVASNGPILAGLALGGLVTLALAGALGWLPQFRTLAPGLLFLGGLGVTLVGAVARRQALRPRTTLLVELTSGTLVAVLALVAFPRVGAAFQELLRYLSRTGQSNVAETVSLFGGALGSILGPVMLFGGLFFIGVPYLCWGLLHVVRTNRQDWLLAETYTWFFLVLAVVQIRFAGQLAMFLGAFIGLGFVHVAATIERVAVPPAFRSAEDRPVRDGGSRGPPVTLPDAPTVARVTVLFVVVAAFSIGQVPARMDQVAVDDRTYETATWIEDHAAANDRSGEASYVLSHWGQNRVYNYFVNGDSESYDYARQHYQNFSLATSPETWVERFRDRPVGYVVTRDAAVEFPTDSMQVRLHSRYGSRGANVPGLGHFAFRYQTDGGARKVFEVVPGARITNVRAPNRTMVAETKQSVAGRPVTYTRRVETNRYGEYALTVPYGGEYEVGNETVTAEESTVRAGGFTGPYRSHWAFDEGSGTTVEDELTDHTGQVHDAAWTSGVAGQALAFDGQDDLVTVENTSWSAVGEGSVTLSLWVKGSLARSNATYPHVVDHDGPDGSGVGIWGRASQGDFGVRFDDVDGTRVRNFGIDRLTFDRWTHVAVVLDRSRDSVALYRNGTLVSARDASALGRVDADGTVTVGGSTDGEHASVQVDDYRVYATALEDEAVADLAEGP